MKKTFLTIAFVLLGIVAGFAQTEQAPIVEKPIKYKNFKFQDVNTLKDVELRESMTGWKLVLVVYFAPWCPNWKHEAPIVQRLYDKYKGYGLEIIGVGEYDSIDMIKASVANFKITFPVVYESQLRDAKTKTTHYEYRQATGDTRNWGSPWNIFIVPALTKPKGDTLVEKAFVANGELIEPDAEAFIRSRLGLSKLEEKAVSEKSKSDESCAPTVTLKKPAN